MEEGKEDSKDVKKINLYERLYIYDEDQASYFA